MYALWVGSTFTQSKNTLFTFYLPYHCMTCLEKLFGVEWFAHKFLHVPSSQEDDGHHSHQYPGEEEAKSNSTVEMNK